ncbi:MAG: YIP1 family protein [Alphaproteobacteria bacterium]
MASFPDRLLRAARLDPELYEEVEHDEDALGEAMSVVVASSLAAAIGTGAEDGLGPALAGVLLSLVSWVAWSAISFLVGTRFLPGPKTEADVGQLLRATGFASTPGLIRIFGIVPGLRMIAFVIAALWTLSAMVIAVRQALDYDSTRRAMAVCLIGFVLQALLVGFLIASFGGAPVPTGETV